jgi:hypothetical protein
MAGDDWIASDLADIHQAELRRLTARNAKLEAALKAIIDYEPEYEYTITILSQTKTNKKGKQ